MLPFLTMALVPALVAVESVAAVANDQAVRASKNGEFLWKYYPPGAMKRGEQGRVGFNLAIDQTGTIVSCDVTESSGFSALDQETCDIMGLYAHVEPIRNSDGRAIRSQQRGFIVWKLPPGAAQFATASVKKTMPKPDKLICRKDTVTGSLIATVRQCMTRAEWQEQDAVNKQAIDQMGQGRGYFDSHESGLPPKSGGGGG